MKLPDGPKTPPIIQLIQWISNPLGLMEKSTSRYGDMFTLRLGSFVVVFLSHPQAIQEIFSASAEQFESGKAGVILRHLLGNNSLLLLDGTRHQRQRRLLMPPFHGDRMKAYGQLICDITNQVISNWEIGKPFNVRYSMQEISLRVILQAVFGLDEGERLTELKQLLRSVLNLSGSPLRATILFFPWLQQDLGAWSPWGKFLRNKQRINQLLNAEIEQRRHNHDPSRTDILSLLLSARDENGEAMTNEELRDELMTLLIAGHETTASALTWAMYWIHSSPQVQEKLVAELDSISDIADLNAISRSPYLTAVCQETLRLYPIAMTTLARITKSAFTVMGYEFEPDTILLPSIYLTHHRPDLYPQSKQFQPERFLERQYSQYEFLPFGGGNRRCIGLAFAMFEMKLVLATVLSRFNLALANNRSVKPIRRGLTSAPADGKWLVVKDVRPPASKPEIAMSR